MQVRAQGMADETGRMHVLMRHPKVVAAAIGGS
jgi:hypothetical protein